MKTKNLIIFIALFTGILFNACKKEEQNLPEDKSILPTAFKVDIPQSISSSQTTKSLQGDTIQGNEIYQLLRVFIHVGEFSAEIVQNLMLAIAVYHIDHAMTLSYQSDGAGEDGRTKNLVVIESSSFENATWQYQLTITDAASESNADGGKALQVFWNLSPVKGIAILKPYNCNRNDTSSGQAMLRIDYSEAGEYGYEKHMIVSISDLTVADPLVDPYSMSALKMFAGKTGNIVDVYGNSNHPNAKFYTDNVGFNWAFVAAGNESSDIGVAEVGLPPSNLDNDTRDSLLGYYAIKDVLNREIFEMWPTLDSAAVAAYLYNTEAPGFFNANGFIQGGTAPSSDYTDLVTRIQNLTPYKPLDVSNLSVEFKQ
ncbi:MAG: hypothetical protein HY738_12470 [Bacteroidia bacterium]|nr:hypothetical protein [Bacteroidia bacterium]